MMPASPPPHARILPEGLEVPSVPQVPCPLPWARLPSCKMGCFLGFRQREAHRGLIAK